MERAAVTLGLALGVLGCAPSLRMVHQSNAYFERCHGADFDPLVAPPDRHGCWKQWLAHYQVGQAPDRVAYARRRLTALESGEQGPTLPGLQTAAAAGAHTAAFFSTSELAANGAPAPPRDGERTAPPSPSPPALQGACNSVCDPRWYECAGDCGGRPAACVEACETEHRICMRGCY